MRVRHSVLTKSGQVGSGDNDGTPGYVAPRPPPRRHTGTSSLALWSSLRQRLPEGRSRSPWAPRSVVTQRLRGVAGWPRQDQGCPVWRDFACFLSVSSPSGSGLSCQGWTDKELSDHRTWWKSAQSPPAPPGPWARECAGSDPGAQPPSPAALGTAEVCTGTSSQRAADTRDAWPEAPEDRTALRLRSWAAPSSHRQNRAQHGAPGPSLRPREQEALAHLPEPWCSHPCNGHKAPCELLCWPCLWPSDCPPCCVVVPAPRKGCLPPLNTAAMASRWPRSSLATEGHLGVAAWRVLGASTRRSSLSRVLFASLAAAQKTRTQTDQHGPHRGPLSAESPGTPVPPGQRPQDNKDPTVTRSSRLHTPGSRAAAPFRPPAFSPQGGPSPPIPSAAAALEACPGALGIVLGTPVLCWPRAHGVTTARAHSHGLKGVPWRSGRPLSPLHTARGAGRAGRTLFFCSLRTNGIQLGKKKPKPGQAAF